MRLLQVEINDCFKYGAENNIFDFTNNPLTLIVGLNGSGKSSIFDAVCYALYGKTIRWGQTHDEIVRRGKDSGYVNLNFEKDGNIYEIHRARSIRLKQSYLKFSCVTTGENMSGRKSKEVNSDIIDIIGMDFSSFRNSVLFGQDDIERIVSLKSKDRLVLLSSFLGITFLDSCFETADFQIDSLRTKLDILQDSIQYEKKLEIKRKMKSFNELQKTIEEEVIEDREKFDNYSDLYKKISRLQNGAQSAEQTISQTQESIREKQGIVKRLTIGVRQQKESLKKLEKRLKSSILAYDVLTKLKNEIGKADGTLQEFSGKIAVIKDRIRNVRNKIKQIKRKKVCTECETIYTEEMRTKLILKEKGKLEPLLVESEKVGKKNAKVRLRIKEVKKEMYRMELLSRPDEIERKISEVKRAKKSEDAVEELMREMSSKRNLIKRQRVILNDIKEQGYTEGRLKNIHERMLDIRGKVSTKEANIKTIQDKIAKAKLQLTEIRESEKQAEILEEKLKRLVFISNMFSKTGGLRQVIIENVLPVLNKKINKYLDTLTMEPITVEFTTGVKTKSGKFRNKLDILIWSPQGAADFGSYSGGEKKSIVLAMGLGLSEMAAESVGADCEFLLLDEVFSSLDSKARKRLVNLLYKLQGKFKNVVVISHLNELRNQIPGTVIIKKGKGISRILQ